MTNMSHVRNGMGTVRPYLYGPAGLLTFLEQTFAAEVTERSPDGGEVELRIGDSIIAVTLGDDFPDGVDVTRASVYVYVPDVDAAFSRALNAGATSISAPRTEPYGERIGGVKDVFGNVWYISTRLGV